MSINRKKTRNPANTRASIYIHTAATLLPSLPPIPNPLNLSFFSSSSSSMAIAYAILIPLLLLSTGDLLSAQSTCKTQKFTSNRVFSTCVDLPQLSSSLHWSYDSPSSTLRLAFTATPSAPGGWIAWGINPDGPMMSGAQSLVAFRAVDGTVVAKTYNVSGYRSIVQGKIAYDVQDLVAEEDGDGGVMRLFATMRLPEGMVKVSHVWQVGPSVDGDNLAKHSFGTENLMAKGTLDLLGGMNSGVSGRNDKLSKRNIHGVLNAVSWGILLPIGAIIARYLKTFKSADPAWFYLHVTCQICGYIVGVAGWGTGLKLGSESKGIEYTTHRSIGIALFCLATIQSFALLFRPNKDHKWRIYWNAYHISTGYVVIILGIINIFRGFNMLNPAQIWKTSYISILAVLAGIAAVLEVITWIIFFRNKYTERTKITNGNDRHQQLHA